MKACLVFLLVFLFLGSSVRADTVSLRGCYENRQWAPFVIGEGEEIPYAPGVFIELLNKAAPASNFLLSYIRRPWKRCLALLQRGEVELVIGGSYLEERDVYAVYPMTGDGRPDHSRALEHSAYFLYTTQNSAVSWNGRELTGAAKPLGVDLGYSAGAILKEMGLDIQEINEVARGFRLLRDGRLDGYVTFHNRAKNHIDAAQGDIHRHPRPVLERAYYLMASNALYDTHPARVETLWNRLRELRDQLEAQLLAKYQALRTH